MAAKNWLVERRLRDTSARLRQARTDLAVVEEQLAVVREEAEDLRLRAIVSEHQADLAEHVQGKRHFDAMTRSRADLVHSIDRLSKLQDELLDRLSAK